MGGVRCSAASCLMGRKGDDMNSNRDILEQAIDAIQAAELDDMENGIAFTEEGKRCAKAYRSGLYNAARILEKMRKEAFDANKEV